MRESLLDEYPISEFPSEGDIVQPAAPAPGPPAAAPGSGHAATLLEALSVAAADPAPPHPRVLRLRSGAETKAAVRQWVARVRARRYRLALSTPVVTFLSGGAETKAVVKQWLAEIVTRRSARQWLAGIMTRRYRPALSMPVVTFLSGLALGALGMWMVPASMDGAVATAESTRVEATPQRRPITLAGVGGAPSRTATSGSKSIAPSPAVTATLAVVPRTVPPPQEAVTRRTVDAAVRRAPQQPSAPRRQAAAPRSAAGAGTGYRGSLSVGSRPEGASVFINGRLVGTTPLVLTKEAVGSRAVRVTLGGYGPWAAAARVVADRETALHAELRRLPAR